MLVLPSPSHPLNTAFLSTKPQNAGPTVSALAPGPLPSRQQTCMRHTNELKTFQKIPDTSEKIAKRCPRSVTPEGNNENSPNPTARKEWLWNPEISSGCPFLKQLKTSFLRLCESVRKGLLMWFHKNSSMIPCSDKCFLRWQEAPPSIYGDWLQASRYLLPFLLYTSLWCWKSKTKIKQSHMGASSGSVCSTPIKLLAHGLWKAAHVFGSPHPHGRPKWSLWFLASTWPNAPHCGHLESEPEDERALTHSLCLSLSLWLFQNK